MPQDNLAHDVAGGGETPDAPLYDALVAALRSNARGRAFLDEYARRARATDTAAALAALARIEALLLKDQSADPVAEMHEIDPDNAYVPFEFEPLPETGVVAAEAKSDFSQAFSPASLSAPTRSADLMAQVMALSPEERIALFS